MECLTNPISQPSLDTSPIWIPLISNEVSNSKGTSVWSDRFFMGFCKILVPGFSFYSRDGASGRQKMVWHEILQLMLCVGFHGLGLLHRIFDSFSVLFSGLCMLHDNFYCTLSCYLPLTKPDLGYIYIAVVILTLSVWHRLSSDWG
jgi:hypothetical protein